MSWVGLVITLGGFGAYFAVAGSVGLFQRVPWAFVAVMTLGLGLALAGFARRPRVASGVGALLTAGVFAVASWYLFSYSIFDGREARPAVGESFPTFAALPTSTGGTFRLEDARGKHLLLLFYRGSW